MPDFLVPFTVTTTTGRLTLMARDLAHAIASALELAGPGTRILTCLRGGDW